MDPGVSDLAVPDRPGLVVRDSVGSEGLDRLGSDGSLSHEPGTVPPNPVR